MPTRTDESPARQQDRALEGGLAPRDEVRNSEPDAGRTSADDDASLTGINDGDINTHGSER
jgi:hypothetical protein